MAANLQRRGFSSVGKRVIGGNWIAGVRSSVSAAAVARRSVHVSAYDKNVEEQVRPALVPDYVIDPKVEYWAPHPTTGVFGPAEEKEGCIPKTAQAGAGNGSVLDEKVWFRPLANVDKPQAN